MERCLFSFQTDQVTKKLCAASVRLNLLLIVSAARTHHSKSWAHISRVTTRFPTNDHCHSHVSPGVCLCLCTCTFARWFCIMGSERSKWRDLLCELRCLLLSLCCALQICSHHALCTLDFLPFFFHTLTASPSLPRACPYSPTLLSTMKGLSERQIL